jgi:CMP-N-acetylneuraminic acid synthetase
MISIIIRTKNEERWINPCLDAIACQTESDYEVILVDNQSTDKTVDKALRYGVRLVTVTEFMPGAAINRGIEASRGEIIVCLSGHCIPVDENWLQNLVHELQDEQVAGVYGRQKPFAFTPDLDKRDLLMMFGLDRREQVKDSFFHNANSAFRRSLWERFPFDECVTNIEDRIWAHTVQREGYKIIYEPNASVFHYHGINHERDTARCGNIIRILETVGPEETRKSNEGISPEKLNVIVIIPVREEGLRPVARKPLYAHAIEHASKSALANSIVVSTDQESVAKDAVARGVDLVLRRSGEESRFDVILEQLMQISLQALENQGIFPDILVMLEPTFPFRSKSIVDTLIQQYSTGGFDTVIPARVEYNSCWMDDSGYYRRVDAGYIARQFKTPFYTGLKGLCCVCSPAIVRRGELFGDNVGLYKLEDSLQAFEVRNDPDAAIAEALLDSSALPVIVG